MSGSYTTRESDSPTTLVIMGRGYSEEQRVRVKGLLEQGRDEETIEKETGVSDRTIRRWKLELERTGRIGKPPESRTGRHRVLSSEVEAALFDYVKDKPDMSVDDMLWWLYDTYKIVVGTRTIRRVFERKGDKVKPGKGKGPTARKSDGIAQEVDEDDDEEDEEGLNGLGDETGDMTSLTQDSVLHQPNGDTYPTPYAAMSVPPAMDEGIEQQLRQAMEQQQDQPQQQQQQQMPQPVQHPYPALAEFEAELPDDEETIQLQLQQIALQKREVELKLKMRKLHGGKGTPSSRSAALSTPPSAPSSLYNPRAALTPGPPKRDSRSKKKIEESRRRTAERQERMLRDLERRSRRRDHLTAEWVQSKDIWPLRAQSMLADLMHQYGCYAYTQNNDATFDAMYRDLYQLVDLNKGDWSSQMHDEMLRERMKRKMGQLRTKMQKTGEIIGRGDGYGGFQKAENFTGEAAGQAIGDESEMVQDPALHAAEALQVDPNAGTMHDGHMHPNDEAHMQYDPVPDQQMPHANMYPNPMMPHQAPGQYPIIDQHQAQGQYLPYTSMSGQHQDGMVM